MSRPSGQFCPALGPTAHGTARKCRLEGMDNLVVLEIFFSSLVGLAALGALGVGIKVVTSLFKDNR